MTAATPMPRDTHVTTTTVAGTGTNPPDRSPAAGGQGAPSHPPEGAPAPRRRNKPKAIGTADESAAVRALHRLGFPHAERRALRGRKDAGDILVCPGIVAESKGGNAGRNATDTQVGAWLVETETERTNAGAVHGFLILPRKNIGPANAHRWWAVLWVSTLLDLHYETGLRQVPANAWCAWSAPWHDGPVRVRLDHWCAMLTAAGYGTPPDRETS